MFSTGVSLQLCMAETFLTVTMDHRCKQCSCSS